ncbi:MAG TPA: HEAT repeat domain-containing protein [Polyangia bacterium]|nr:HEAT repeat domain-containing protein [Polyangia bacterium]
MAALIVAASAGGAGASAERPGLIAASLDAGERAKLAGEVERARRETPQAFANLAAIGGVRPEVYMRTRARRPEATRDLRRLGPSGLWPMLEVAALRGFPPQRALSDGERLALERGLVEVLGELGDARAIPVLRAALVGGANDRAVEEGAAVALGKLCGERELRLLIDLSRAGDARRASAIAGLGQCRQIAAAERLAAIAGERDAGAAEAAVRALGTIGSSWAWATGSAGDAATGERIRAIAAQAMVRAGASGAVPVERVAPELSLLDAPSVANAIAAERARADGAALERLDRLAPTRR